MLRKLLYASLLFIVFLVTGCGSGSSGENNGDSIVTSNIPEVSGLTYSITYPTKNANLGGLATTSIIRGNITKLNGNVAFSDIDFISVNNVFANIDISNPEKWSVDVPVNPGINTFDIIYKDSLGLELASQLIINNELISPQPKASSVDSDQNRIIVFDINILALFEVDLIDGSRRIISNNVVGEGASLSGTVVDLTLDIDSNNAYLLTRSDDNYVFEIDLSNGNRRIVSGLENGDGPEIGSFDMYGLTIDEINNTLYITSAYAAGIVSIDIATGNRAIVSSHASIGEGPALFNARGVAFDSSKNRLLVTDASLDAVIEIDLSTGDRSIISDSNVGNGVGFSFPFGLQLDLENNRVIVFDALLSSLIQVNLNTGDRIVISDGSNGSGPDINAGITNFSLDFVNNRAILPSSRLYTIDLSDGERDFLSSDIDTGTGDSFTTPHNLAFDTLNNRILLSNYFGDGLIHSIDINSGNRQVISSDSDSEIQFLIIEDFVFDQDNMLILIPSPILAAIISVDTTSGARKIVSDDSNGSGPSLSEPIRIALDPDNNTVYVIDKELNALIEIDLLNGNRVIISDNFIGTGPLIESATDVEIDLENNRIFVLLKKSVISIDLTTGNRLLVSDNSIVSSIDFEFAASFVLDLEHNRAFILDSILNSIMEIDINSGVRMLYSDNNIAKNINFLDLEYFILDNSHSRLFLIDSLSVSNSVIVQDIPSQERAILSRKGSERGASGFSN